MQYKGKDRRWKFISKIKISHQTHLSWSISAAKMFDKGHLAILLLFRENQNPDLLNSRNTNLIRALEYLLRYALESSLWRTIRTRNNFTYKERLGII